jgi:hypothetical protein
MPMTDEELCNRLRDREADAIQFNSTFGTENEENLSYYLARPFGNEIADQSQVVSTDCADVVEADMPSLARVFLGPNPVITFAPNSKSEADVKEAEDKTQYIDWLVRGQSHSFQTQLGWLKDSEIQKFGAVKYFIEDVETTKEVKMRGLSELEITQAEEDLDSKDVKSIDRVKEEDNEVEEGDEPTFDITFRITTRSGNRATYKGVDTGNLLITRGSESVDEASLVGDIMTKTRGELKAMGVSVTKINKIPTAGSKTVESSKMNTLRFSDEGGDSSIVVTDAWAAEYVELLDLYVKVDYDQDGIAERRRVLKSRFEEVIIINEAFDHVPYAIISSIIMPHSAIGRSRVEVTKSNQLQKSKLLRESFDNTELVNHPGIIVNDDNVNVDDMLTVRSGRIIRTDGVPSQDAFPLVVPSVLSESLQFIQYLDFARAQTTGTLMASQGLDADALNSETATRFVGVQDEGSAKIELVARGIAEVGYKKLYDGMAWLVSHFQDSSTEIMVLGKELTVDPRKWRFDHKAKSEISEGAGDQQKQSNTLTGILQIQQQMKAAGSPLVDEVKIFNTLDKLVKVNGLARVDEFFNNPEVEDDLLKARNEILTNTVEQLQQMVQQLQNPLAEAEEIKGRAKLIEAEGKQELDAANMLKDMKEFREEMKLEFEKLDESKRQANMKTATDLTKLELDSGEEVPGGLV